MYLAIFAFFLWTTLPLLIMVLSSIKEAREAFQIPAIGDWAGAFMKLFSLDYGAPFIGDINNFVTVFYGLFIAVVLPANEVSATWTRL